jgi:hypothetical protein
MSVAFPRLSGASPVSPPPRLVTSEDVASDATSNAKRLPPSNRGGVAATLARVATKFFLSTEEHPEVSPIVLRIAEEKRTPSPPLKVLLAKLRQEGVSEDDVPARLEAAADELVKLRAENDSCENGSSQIAAIAIKARALIDRGDFDKARAAFARGQAALRKSRDELSRHEAQLLAQEARIDHLQMAFRISRLFF